MGEGLIWLSSISGYLTVGGYAYRKRYVTLYKAWRRWQAEDPQGIVERHLDYGVIKKPRKDVPYWAYVWSHQTPKERTPPFILAPLWPFYWLTKGVIKVLHPEVKVPDYEKIKDLEKD